MHQLPAVPYIRLSRPRFLTAGVAAFVLLLATGFQQAVAAPPATYSVQSGDSLYAIAAKFGVAEDDRDTWIAAVVRLNALASADVLTAGQVLSLPPSSIPAGARSASSAPTGATAAAFSYAVQPGDTLGAIAVRLGVPESGRTAWLGHVVDLNGLAGPDALVAGQAINMPSAAGGSASGANSATSANTAATSQYVVQPGDTLSSIGAKRGVAGADLNGWIANVTRLSTLSDADNLTAGQTLVLPGGSQSGAQSSAAFGPNRHYTVQTGDTLVSIAVKLGIDDGDLPAWTAKAVELSGLAGADLLSVGQSLTVPSPAAKAVPATSAPAAGAGGAMPAASGLTYSVQSGEILSGIAAKLGIDDGDIGKWIAAIVKLNDMQSADSLIVGQSLALPASPAPIASAVATTTYPPPMPLPPSAPTAILQPAGAALFGGGRFYTVQKSDTLQSIGVQLGIPADRLSAWMAQVAGLNGVSPNALPVGDALRLP